MKPLDLDFWRRSASGPPRIVGHRGAKGDAPENTLGSFARAVSLGTKAVELDVRTCATGELVVFHDPTLARLTEGRDARRIADLPFSELARVRLPAGERVPMLAEVLERLAPDGAGVNVEMKHDVPDRAAVVRATAELLRAKDPRVPVIVSSFHPAMLLALAPLAPGIPLALLVHRSNYHPAMIAAALAAARLGRPALHAVHLERTITTARRVTALRERGLLVSVWTVNDRAEASRLASMGVDSVISDEPGGLLQAGSEPGRSSPPAP